MSIFLCIAIMLPKSINCCIVWRRNKTTNLDFDPRLHILFFIRLNGSIIGYKKIRKRNTLIVFSAFLPLLLFFIMFLFFHFFLCLTIPSSPLPPLMRMKSNIKKTKGKTHEKHNNIKTNFRMGLKGTNNCFCVENDLMYFIYFWCEFWFLWILNVVFSMVTNR